MKKLKKSLVYFFLLAMGVGVFSGCQTAEGFGEDMEKAGEEIQEGVN